MSRLRKTALRQLAAIANFDWNDELPCKSRSNSLDKWGKVVNFANLKAA